MKNKELVQIKFTKDGNKELWVWSPAHVEFDYPTWIFTASEISKAYYRRIRKERIRKEKMHKGNKKM